MIRCTKHIALLTALTLLCGCTGNTSSESAQTSATEAAVTSESQSPAGENVLPDGTAESTTADAAQPAENGQSGVSLVSGGIPQYSDIFELNGTWCDVSELPFNIVSYEVPLLREVGKGCDLLGCSDGNLYFIKQPFPGYPVSVWSYDPEAGEENLVYDLPDYGQTIVRFVNDQYLVTENMEGEQLVVTDLYKDKVVFDTSEVPENIMLYPGGGVQIVYDMMYITAQYYMPEFNQTCDVGIMVELNTGEIRLYGLDFHNVSYGVGNVLFSNNKRTESIRGDIQTNSSIYTDSDTSISFNMKDTYYMTYSIERAYDALGSRSELFWNDRNNEKHRLGQTAFSVYASPEQFRLDRSSIFTATLSKLEQDQNDDGYAYRKKEWLLLGKYDPDTDSIKAALTEVQDDLPQVVVTNECIYLLNLGVGRVTMLYE